MTGGPFTVGVDLEALVQALAELPPDSLEPLRRRLGIGVVPDTPRRNGPLATIPEVANHLSCRRQRVDTLLSRGRLTRVKDGGRTLIAWAEVDRYLAGEETGPVGEAIRNARRGPRK